jgi:aspartate/tyrosine/aromatic aminotransferase
MADRPINDEDIEQEVDKEASPEITIRDAIAEVRTTIFGKEEVSQDRIRIRPFVSNAASISVKAGFTKNLGNYESARVDVMLTMPCYPEEVDRIYEEVKDWVDARIDYLWKEIEGGKSAKTR